MGSGKMLRAYIRTRLGIAESTAVPYPRGVRFHRPRVARNVAAAIAILLLSACDPPPLVTAVDTLCASTSRPVITEAQRAAFRADQALWEPLVDWLAGFLKVRDGACLKSVSGA